MLYNPSRTCLDARMLIKKVNEMTFQVRNQLMQLVSQNAIAYNIANEFVSDSADRLTVFTTAYNETHGNTIESRTQVSKDVAKERWLVMYPEEIAQ